MTLYEYAKVVGELNEDRLNELGTQGWEHYAVDRRQVTHDPNNIAVTNYFKRPCVEGKFVRMLPYVGKREVLAEGTRVN